MAELTGYYDAFGYEPASLEPCDHITVEAGFIGYLRLKEAYALACEDSEHADIASNTARHFVRDHLAAIAVPLGNMLGGSGVRYLELAGQALVQNAEKIMKSSRS